MSHEGFVTRSQSQAKLWRLCWCQKTQVFPFTGNGLRRFAKLLKRQSFALTSLILQNKSLKLSYILLMTMFLQKVTWMAKVQTQPKGEITWLQWTLMVPFQKILSGICDKFRFQAVGEGKFGPGTQLTPFTLDPWKQYLYQNRANSQKRDNAPSNEWGKSHQTRYVPGWEMSRSTPKSPWTAGHSRRTSSCHLFIYLKPGTILAHDNHKVINGINLNNASLWEYKTVLLSRYFHTH